MNGKEPRSDEPAVNRVHCACVTAALWVYFLGACVLGYWAVFLGARLLKGVLGLRWAIAWYLRGFFALLRLLAPRLSISIRGKESLSRLRGTIIVSNHLSFLDPMLVLAVVPNATTIVRADLLKIPVFGWILRAAGFLPSVIQGDTETWLTRVRRELGGGANLLVFPEGKRSRSGAPLRFHTGAFFLARQLGAPLELIRIAGTGRVFEPGKILFRIGPPMQIELEPVASESESLFCQPASLRQVSERVRNRYATLTGPSKPSTMPSPTDAG